MGATTTKQKRFTLIVCAADDGGYYGRGDTEADAIAACKDACRDAGDRWASFRSRQVMIETATGKELWRKGKR